MKDNTAWILARLEGGYGLPSLSPVAIKLVEVATNPTASAADLVRIIEKDPSLSARLLKLANSAFLRTLSPARTLEQAVVRIGFTRLRIMALSISLRDTFPMGRVGPMDYEKFWKISLYRAVIARILANHVKEVDPEEAFVSGLLMEIGLLVFFDLFIKDSGKEVSLELEPLEDLLSWERQEFGMDHRDVGRIMLEHWKFPEPILSSQDVVNIVAGEPRQEAGGQEDYTLLQTVLYMARRSSQILFLDSTGLHTLYQEGKQLLGLGHEHLSQTIVNAFGLVEDVARQLNVEFDRERDLMALMEKANIALSQISEQVHGYGAEKLPSLTSLPQRDKKIENALQAVAHEIRNPLVAVGGFARRLAASIEPGSQEAKYIKIILEEASRLEGVLSKLVGAAGTSSP